jgi:8-oxo-dGTP pyrophosphatase MutT (NUDIX family)
MTYLADDPFEVSVVASERVFEGKIWDIRQDVFEYGEHELTREYVDHTGAVAVLVLDEEDRVLLIKQYRHPIGKRDWEIPAGLLDKGTERPLVGAKRELAEEVDLTASQWDLLVDFATSPGGSNELLRVYLARGISAAPEAFGREEEEADLHKEWVPLDDVVDAVLARTVSNSILSIAALAAQASRARGWTTLGDADAEWPARLSGQRGYSAEAQ